MTRKQFAVGARARANSNDLGKSLGSGGATSLSSNTHSEWSQIGVVSLRQVNCIEQLDGQVELVLASSASGDLVVPLRCVALRSVILANMSPTRA